MAISGSFVVIPSELMNTLVRETLRSLLIHISFSREICCFRRDAQGKMPTPEISIFRSGERFASLESIVLIAEPERRGRRRRVHRRRQAGGQKATMDMSLYRERRQRPSSVLG